MSAYKVDVRPEVLVWARETIDLTRENAARELGMSELDLRYLEEGVGDVSMSRLRNMAKTYDRPLISFFLDEPGSQIDTLPDFRLARSNRRRPWSPKLHKEYRRVAGQREVILDLVSSADLQPIPLIDLRLSSDDDPEECALQVRHWLLANAGVSSTRPAFSDWVSLIEERGALVTQVSGIDVDEMRGFSIGLHPLPVIALNGADSPSARLFSLLHELVHVLLHASALCDLRGVHSGKPRGKKTEEWFCNAVAAAVLMPRRELLQRDTVRRASCETRWQFGELRALANEFGVSTEALLLRLITIGSASQESYGELKKLFEKLRGKQSRGFLPYYRGKIRNLGRRYIETILLAYDRGEITDATLSRYLDIKLKNMPKLIEQFNPGS